MSEITRFTKAVVIGSSTGGPKALETILEALPEDFNAVVIIIQHLPIEFTESMSKRLDEKYPIHISQIKNGEYVKPNHVYVVPGDFHFFLTSPDYQSYLLRANGNVHPSINMGFVSVAEHFGKQTIGVALTGMGDDGLYGAKAIKQLGGYILAQDKSTSAVYGIPKEIIEHGYADEVLPLDNIATRIVELIS